ncbi:hypothetical protein EYF80_005152 [Liparis tanakae]|uniref:Uncharacterized protein n=1 Tax=Liparis tanakae TaxID=230148 RepID=A0A4Z2J4Q5_9TELE|nr:hypothetical protein EYF80_005152 [Liparis tanakae]
MASMISMMRCSAESAPMVMSVPQKSLSMEPTRPTMFRLKAAAILPSRVVKALQRALPITVPPCSRDVISQVRSQIKTHNAQHSAICH